MDKFRSFTFDNPEDSYWNEASNSDNGNNESTYKKSENFFDEPSTSSISENKLFDSDKEFTNISNKWTDLSFNDVQSLSDKSSIVENSKIDESSNFERKITHIGSASILSDCSLGSHSSAFTVNLDYARLRLEHKKLQKHFENIRKERFQPLPVKDTIKRLKKCQPVSLDLYKTKKQKLDLLEVALDSLDHDIIITVILYLKNTLSKSIFCEILITTESAADHYILYLRESNKATDLVDTLFALGRSDEAAMFEFSAACRLRQPKLKIQALQQCLVSGFSVPILEHEIKYVQEYINSLY